MSAGVTARKHWILDTESINRNARTIVAQIGSESLAVYRWLTDRFGRPDASADPVFQFVYRSFYRMDGAGLTSEFKRAYFCLLGNQRAGSTPDVVGITRTLRAYPNLRGKYTLQFSFATKLANTIAPTEPIFDANVARVYGFYSPSWYESFDNRLPVLCEFHRFLREDYQAILASGRLAAAMEEFESSYRELAQALPPTKKIDFILWSAGRKPTEALNRSP